MLLADNIIVKQLLLDKETNTVGSVCIKHMNNFSEFVKVSNTVTHEQGGTLTKLYMVLYFQAFCDFGQEMVELTVITRWHIQQEIQLVIKSQNLLSRN